MLGFTVRQGGCVLNRFMSHSPHDTSVSKLQAVLRPFIFSVHPDLFGQHPEPKSVNEASLKALHEYIQSTDMGAQLVSDQPLKFYQRTQSTSANNNEDRLKVVKVKLEGDILQTVRCLLKASELSLDAVDEIIETSKRHPTEQVYDRPIQWIQSHYFAATGKEYPFTDIWEEVGKLKPAVTLHKWVSANIKNVLQLEENSLPRRESYTALYKVISDKYCVTDIIWSCGWRGIHQLASLRNLNKLLKREVHYRHLVTDKKIIFGTGSGVSLNGDIALCSDEVPVQWSKALSAVSANNKYLELIPKAEQQLSTLLNDIQIVRRSSPPLPMAPAYYSSLANLIGRLGMSRTMSSIKLSPSLRHLQLAVTGTMGDDMTLTPEGHISVPSHSPVWAINNFIRDNEGAAIELQHKYRQNKKEADRLMDLVKEDYRLQSLSIDSCISYDKVIVCCENLLASSDSVRYMLDGVRVVIAPYFAVMSDGEMYIMWDWVNDS